MQDLRNPDAIDRMCANFAKQGAMATMGITIADVAAGRVVLEMPFDPAFTQHHGFIHAGVLTTAMDSACGFAAFTLMDADAEVLTVEYKASFLSPARGQSFRFEGEVVKSGRTLTFTQGRTIGVDGDQETVVAMLTATMMAVRSLRK